MAEWALWTGLMSAAMAAISAIAVVVWLWRQW